jgi:hypothetical protein
MVSRTIFTLSLAGALVAASCTPPTVRAPLPTLQARAAFDLACPQLWLRLVNFDDRSKGVTGCGRQLSYVESCELLDGQMVCTWEADGPVNAITAPSPQLPTAVPPANAPASRPEPANLDPLGDRY